MASITKQKTGWRAQISVKGVRDSRVLDTKAQAQAWAVEREAQMRRIAETGVNTEKTVRDAFDRYVKEVSPHKRGAAWEETRLAAIAAHKVDGKALGDMKVCEVTADTMGQWRDMRLKTVLGSTILRDLALLSNVFATARKEWKWIAASPTTDVRRPAEVPPRERRVSDEECGRILHQLAGYTGEVELISHRVAVAFLFAIETGMRAGEICGLLRENVVGSVAHLPRAKTGKRDVPLSSRALELLASLPKAESGLYFDLTSSQLDRLFRKARDKAAVGDLTFHDSRHEAITRLAKRLPVLDLARMVGHRDINMLLIYYNESAGDIAKRLG